MKTIKYISILVLIISLNSFASVPANLSGKKISVIKKDANPKNYSLEQNYPNPFNPTTTIKYSIPEDTNVKLVVYDILGNEIAVLVDNHQSAGNFEVKFKADNLSSGIYLYQLKTDHFIQTKKLTLSK